MARSPINRAAALAAGVGLLTLLATPLTAAGQWRGRGYGYGQFTASVRLQVTPRSTEVFVDGYLAGIVDDFDGVFQRLRLPAGDHEIALFLPGHRTMRFEMYLSPFSEQRIRHTMETLGPNEQAEPRPAPVRRGRGAAPPPQAAEPPRESPRRAPPETYGTLSLRVQPPDAEVVIDGDRWTEPAERDVFSIRLTAGRHRIEVRKPNFTQYSEEILIRANRALTLNVALKRL